MRLHVRTGVLTGQLSPFTRFIVAKSYEKKSFRIMVLLLRIRTEDLSLTKGVLYH